MAGFNVRKVSLLQKYFLWFDKACPERTENLNNFNLSPLTLSLSKGKLRTFARSSFISP
jgi:hypothetical protein